MKAFSSSSPSSNSARFRDAQPAATAEAVRALLRMLRDLNLTSSTVAIAKELCVCVDGCLSVDSPALTPLRYRLRLSNGLERVLRVEQPSEDALTLVLADAQGCVDGQAVQVPLRRDERERITAPTIGARLRLVDASAREVEHFLRRVVRGAFRAYA